MKLGITIKRKKDEIVVNRNTNETKIIVKLNQIEKKYLEIDSSLPFLDHMIETFAWRANINIGVKIDKKVNLQHTIAEDIGITLGRSIYELFKLQLSKGLEGFGYSKAILDEAMAEAIVSIEGRINYFLNCPEFLDVDGISGYNLVAFLEGFCQGCKCTLRLNFSGKDPHHCWEAAFRALGYAIKNAFLKNEWRKDKISALKGTLE